MASVQEPLSIEDWHEAHIWESTFHADCPLCVERQTELNRPPLWAKPKPGVKPHRTHR